MILLNKRRNTHSLVLEGEARALCPPAVDEADFLGVAEVVVREAEGAQGGALARGVVEALEADGGELLRAGAEAVGGRAGAAEDVVGEVEGGEGRAAGGGLEEDGGACARICQVCVEGLRETGRETSLPRKPM